MLMLCTSFGEREQEDKAYIIILLYQVTNCTDNRQACYPEAKKKLES